MRQTRILLQLFMFSFLVSPVATKTPLAQKYLLYVGTYTGAESKGIYAWRFDAGTGKTEALGLVAESQNPSFLAVAPGGRFLYAVNELGEYQGQKSGAVSAFAIDRTTGKLKSLNDVSSRGAHPCFIALDGAGRHALVSNYTGGSVVVLPIGKDGRLGSASSFVQFVGKGVDPIRQEAPHAHSINLSPDGRFAIVADLGMDQLRVYRFDARTGKLHPNAVARTAPGAGPRHIAFRPDGKFVYVLNELQGSITTYQWDTLRGTLQELRTVSTLPPDFKGANTCAEIRVHPSGQFVYASNRGHDSLAVFSIDPRSGDLKQVQCVSTGGKTPRNFAMDPSGRWLLAENQESANIVIFRIDGRTGQLTPTGDVLNVASPVCLRFLAAN